VSHGSFRDCTPFPQCTVIRTDHRHHVFRCRQKDTAKQKVYLDDDNAFDVFPTPNDLFTHSFDVGEAMGNFCVFAMADAFIWSIDYQYIRHLSH
jgi:hypothetical protein